jgi:SAM-dependent methyltransferase
MLQLKTAGFKALDNLRREGIFPPRWQNMEELESAVNRSVLRFFDERRRVSGELGGVFLLSELLDHAVRTRQIEHMDDSRMPEGEKLEMVKALDRQNVMMQLYPRYIELLVPMIIDIAEKEKRDTKVLELASGSGGLALALGEEAQTKNLPVTIIGSDIVPAYVEAGNTLATEKGVPVSFRLLNALDLRMLGQETFDLIVISQSLHHFTPGQLAVMIAQSTEHTTKGFIGIDGYRSVLLTCGVPLIASLQGSISFTLDGFTSARKFYTEIELDMIAEIATGKREHQVTCSWPLTVLKVQH